MAVQIFQETEIVHYSYIPQMDKDSLDGDVFVYEIVERYLGALSGRLNEVLSILDDADTVMISSTMTLCFADT